jgi:hypothetical protein
MHHIRLDLFLETRDKVFFQKYLNRKSISYSTSIFLFNYEPFWTNKRAYICDVHILWHPVPNFGNMKINNCPKDCLSQFLFYDTPFGTSWTNVWLLDVWNAHTGKCIVHFELSFLLFLGVTWLQLFWILELTCMSFSWPSKHKSCGTGHRLMKKIVFQHQWGFTTFGISYE